VSREEESKLLDAKIAKLEKLLSLLRAKEDIRLRNRFAVGFAQKLYVRTKYSGCKNCEKEMIAEACLESRLKTGKCIFEVDYERLKKLPWPTKEADEVQCCARIRGILRSKLVFDKSLLESAE
jgi:hypothetical protein